LQVSEGRLRFSHPLLAVAALNRVAPSVRRALHGRLAVSVADEEERGRHLVLFAARTSSVPGLPRATTEAPRMAESERSAS